MINPTFIVPDSKEEDEGATIPTSKAQAIKNSRVLGVHF